MKKARPFYETSYKLEVAKMVVDQGLPISQDCKDLTIGSSAVTRMNEVWVADITYIRTQSGWLYLAAVMNLYARKIVGWVLAPHMRSNFAWHNSERAHSSLNKQTSVKVVQWN